MFFSLFPLLSPHSPPSLKVTLWDIISHARIIETVVVIEQRKTQFFFILNIIEAVFSPMLLISCAVMLKAPHCLPNTSNTKQYGLKSRCEKLTGAENARADTTLSGVCGICIMQ